MASTLDKVKEMVKVKINGKEVEVEKNSTILQACKKLNIDVPTLCYHEDLKPIGSCGVCVVEIKGAPTLKRSCTTPVAEGMEIYTHSKKVLEARKTVMELILSNHPTDCLKCIRNGTCELQDLSDKMGIREIRFEYMQRDLPVDDLSYSVVRDSNKCILCGRCVQVCKEVQTVFAIDFVGRGINTVVSAGFDVSLANSVCVNCGQCIAVCPVGALHEKTEIDKVWEALNDPEKHVVVQEAPSVRVGISEEFGMEPGTVSSGRMHAALRRLGFDRVFDTNFAADLTIVEEGTEVVEIIKSGNLDHLPVVTSCSPGWIKFMETFFPDFKFNVSSAKSPQQMFGAVAKTYYARKANIDPKNIVSVSIMPCTAKKFEARRPEMRASGYQDVDYVLTTREFAKMIRQAGIDFKNLPEEKPDDMLGLYSGAGTIFGATGGVMEAALRTAYELITGKPLDNVELTAIRGINGVREAEIEITPELKLKVAVAHGLGNARKLFERVREYKQKTGKPLYHFIEIMACPGGCVGGGGQPHGSTMAKKARRMDGLYWEDKHLKYRKSHENPMINKLYEEFLGEPNSELAKSLLHTSYKTRDRFTGQIKDEN